jgi:hypothetical protein
MGKSPKLVSKKMKNFYLVLSAVFLPLFTFAQTEFGSIQGRVTDIDSESISGVFLIASSPSSIGGNVITSSDDRGFYKFPVLSPGLYELKAEFEGYQTIARKNIRLNLGSTVTIDFTLQPETVSETITVVGTPSLIDTTTTAMSKTVPAEIVQNLPNPQDITAILSFTPGVGDDQVAYGATGFTANRIWIDGVDVSSPTLGQLYASMNYNWIEEVQVTGLGAPAEYGEYTGIVGNFLTRSGSNSFHGLFETFFQNENLVSNNTPDTDLQSKFNSYDVTGQLGGPILRDKLWFFTGFHYPYSEEQPFGYKGVVTTKYPKLISKLTYKPNQNNTLQGFVHYNYQRMDGGSGAFSIEPANALILPEASTINTCNESSWNVTWISLLSPQTNMDARFGGFLANCSVSPRNGNTPGHLDAVTGISSVNSINHGDFRRFRPQFNVSMSHFANDFLGEHDFKFGVQIERSNVINSYGYNNETWYYDYYGPYLRFSGPDINVDVSNHRTSSYIQDNWNLSDRLTLSAGIRWDHNRGISDRGTVFATDSLAPRVGFIWDLKGDGKTIIKTHYGDYYDALLSAQVSLLSNTWLEEGILEYFDSETGQWIESERFNIVADGDRNRGHPFVRQFVIGVDQEFSNRTTLGAHFIHRTWKNILGYVDNSSIYEPVPFLNPITGETIDVYHLIQEGTEPILLTNPPSQFRKYDGIEIVANRRFSERLTLSASFVYSRIHGNVPNSFETANPANNNLTDPNNTINFTGHLINDPTFAWKIVGHWSLPWGLNTGWFYRHESGDTWTPRILVIGLNQDPFQILGLPLGSNRLPSTNILDLRLEKEFPIQTGEIRITADIFNVFNGSYITEIDPLYKSPNFEQPLSFNKPRSIRLGVRYTF